MWIKSENKNESIVLREPIFPWIVFYISKYYINNIFRFLNKVLKSNFCLILFIRSLRVSTNKNKWRLTGMSNIITHFKSSIFIFYVIQIHSNK